MLYIAVYLHIRNNQTFKTNIMKTLQNLPTQAKVFFIAAIFLIITFSFMVSSYGFQAF